MELKSKAGPINAFVINQNAGSSGPVSSFPSQCQLTSHSNTLSTSACNTTPGISEGEAVSHLHENHTTKTVNSGMTIVSQTTETEVTSAIGGSIVTPVVVQDNVTTVTDQTIAGLLSINEMSEMSQDDGKLVLKT